MMTQEQIEISKEVQNFRNNNDISEQIAEWLLLDDITEYHPDVNFIYESLKAQKNLMLMLDIVDQRFNFVVNALYFYDLQLKQHSFGGVQHYIAKELAQKDVLDLFKTYNNIEIDILETSDC